MGKVLTETTYTKEEKEVLDKIRNLRIELETLSQNLEKEFGNHIEIGNIRYYDELLIETNDEYSKTFALDTILIKEIYVVEKEVNGKIEYELYSKDKDENTIVIGIVDEKGKVVFLNESLKNSTKSMSIEDIEELEVNGQKVNKEHLKAESKLQEETKEINVEANALNRQNDKTMKDNQKEEKLIDTIEIDLNKKITSTETFCDLVPETNKYEKVKAKRISNTQFIFYGVTKERKK